MFILDWRLARRGRIFHPRSSMISHNSQRRIASKATKRIICQSFTLAGQILKRLLAWKWDKSPFSKIEMYALDVLISRLKECMSKHGTRTFSIGSIKLNKRNILISLPKDLHMIAPNDSHKNSMIGKRHVHHPLYSFS